jgi:hypothetical protein
MIKKVQLKVVIILLLNVALHLSTQSQTRKYLIINGKIMPELNDSDNSSVQIIKNNQKAVLAPIPENGKFRLELEYNTEYQLIFNKKGNQSKTIIVNTEIPEKAVNSPSNFPHFLMAVKLFVDNQNPENLYSKNQIQHISYSPQNDCFIRVPTMLDIEYVEKGNSNQNSKIESQENKTKLQEYKVF